MEVKHFEIEEIKTDDESRTIEGWGSVFNVVDKGKDIVLPGAFLKSLKNGKPAMLWQHRSDEPIGVWEEATEYERGLYLKGSFADTARGNDAYKLVKMKAIKGLSIGYCVKQSEYDTAKGIRKIKEADLHEVSLVTFPMNDMAKVTRVKSDNGALMTEREFEEFLRDVGGLSQTEAKRVVSEGYRSMLSYRDGGDAELIQLLTQFNAQLREAL